MEGKRRRKGGSKKGVCAPPIFTTDPRHCMIGCHEKKAIINNIVDLLCAYCR